MKKCLSVLAALLVLCLCLPALAGESYVIDEMRYTTLYDAVPRGDGTTLLLYNMRDNENYVEGQNDTIACLRCVGAKGETLWEHRQDGAEGTKNIYGKGSMLSDGSALIIYHCYGGEELWELRKFSPTGELKDSRKLPEDYLQSFFVPGGVLVQTMREDQNCELTLYGEDMQPIWRQVYADFRMPQLYTQQRVGGDIAIVAREKRDGEPQRLALLLDGRDGHVLWQRKLGPKDGICLTAADPKGRLWILNTRNDSKTKEIASATILCLSASGEVERELSLDVSDMRAREKWDACRVAEDALLILGRAKTETCARLRRYDLTGQLLDVTDSAAREEEAYAAACFAELGSELYAATTGGLDEEDAVVLLPLTKGE